MSEIVVEIRGEAWTGWTSLEVTHALGAAAGTVRLSGAAIPARGLTGSEPIRVLTDGAAVFTGYLDEVEVTLSGEDATFTASGRSRTGDLVDSQIDPYAAYGELHNVTVRDIAFEYAFKGLRIPVIFDLSDDIPRFETFAPTPGESYFSAIERACRMSGVLATATGDGELVVQSPSRFRRGSSFLQQGVNVVALRASTSWRERYRFLVVQGQGAGDADGWENELRILEEAQDEAIRPTRVGVVTLEGDATSETAKRNAEWEVAVRAARGSKVTVTVSGWLQDGGEPWRPGIRVPLALPGVGVSGTLVLDSVALSHGEGGEFAMLGLTRSDAYQSANKLKVKDDPTASLLGWKVDA